MLSSLKSKVKTFISGLNGESDVVINDRKRKKPLEESNVSESDLDLEVIAVKRPRVHGSERSPSVFSNLLNSSTVQSMSDWVQRKSIFSWSSDKKTQSNHVRTNGEGRNGGMHHTGSHHRFEQVEDGYMKGMWPQGKGDMGQSLDKPPNFQRSTVSKTVQTDRKSDLSQGQGSRMPLKQMFNFKSQHKTSAFESVRLDEKVRYQQLLQQFTTVPLDTGVVEEQPTSIRNPVRVPQLPRFYFKSNDSILGTNTSHDIQPRQKPPEQLHKIKVQPSVRSTPRPVVNGEAYDDTSILITDISAIPPATGLRHSQTIDLTGDNDLQIVEKDSLARRSLHQPRGAQSRFSEPARHSVHTGSKSQPLVNGYPEDTVVQPSSYRQTSKTIDLTADDDVTFVKQEVFKKKQPDSTKSDFRDSALMSENWIKDLYSTFNSKAREMQRKKAELEMRTKLFEEKRRYDDLELERQIREDMQIHKKEPPVLEDMPAIEIVDEEEEEEEEEEGLPELTDEMEKKIDYCLQRGSAGEVLADKFRLQITRSDMATLAGLNWLNDEIINFYMNLLMERGEKEGQSKVYAFNTFFYPKVMGGGQSAVKRWTRRVDVLAVDYILIPVHLGMHWCLAVIDFKKKEIRYYDSMGGSNTDCLNALKKYLCDESLDKKKKEFDLSGWKSIIVKDIPQQMNGSDCGMFACKYAEYITRESPITFTQNDMPYFRRRMVYEIHTCQLLQ